MLSYFLWGDDSGDEVVASVGLVVGALIYHMVARITLIVLLLMSLRSLPPGVCDTVAWAKFIPHL
jgi:hypothetical protein